MAAAAVDLARLAEVLPDMTADDLAAVTALCAGMPGEDGFKARRLVECEQAWRERVARTNRIPARRRDLELAR